MVRHFNAGPKVDRMYSIRRLPFVCIVLSLALTGCFMSPQMHLHGLDETTEARFQSLEERVGALEGGGPAIGPPSLPPSGAAGRARAVRQTDYSE